jgi:signal transduction histidine kinase
VDRAVRAHGGRVQVRSTLVQSLEFTVALPWVEAN